MGAVYTGTSNWSGSIVSLGSQGDGMKAVDEQGSCWGRGHAAHLVVLLEQGVDVLEEGDGGCAVDDKIDLLYETLLICGGEAQLGLVQVPGNDHNLVPHVDGHAAILPVHMEQRLLVKQVVDALITCAEEKDPSAAGFSDQGQNLPFH